MPKKDKKIEYAELKATRVKLDEETEYIAVILDADTQWGVEAGLNKVGLERGKKKTVIATYIKDKGMGLVPTDAWAERKRVEVAGTLTPHMDSPVTPDNIVISSGLGPKIWMSCPKCRNMVNANAKSCPHCGAILETT